MNNSMGGEQRRGIPASERQGADLKALLNNLYAKEGPRPKTIADLGTRFAETADKLGLSPEQKQQVEQQLLDTIFLGEHR
jgi:hypothetical protein